MVEDEESLVKACGLLDGEPFVGIDTEADSMYHYREKVCLLQITDRNRDYIVDPLAIGHIGGLKDLLADSSVQKIFHGADYDVVSLKRDFSLEVHNIFDTMVAAQVLGLPRVGLADLCGGLFGAKMDKKYQRHNWAARPLEPEHLDYARGDSHYLLSLRDVLLHKLEKANRTDVAFEEFHRLETRVWSPRAPSPSDWQRIKGSKALDVEAKRVLRSLYAYRDEQARALDRPPYKVIPDAFLMRVAQSRPKNLDQLRSLAKKRSSMIRRHGPKLVESVQKGLENDSPFQTPPKKTPAGPKPPHGGRDTERLLQRLKGWRSEKQEALDLPVAMLASNAHLKVLAGWRPQKIAELEELPDIRQWQIDRYGETWIELITEFETKRQETKSAPGRNRSGRRRKRRRGARSQGSPNETGPTE